MSGLSVSGQNRPDLINGATLVYLVYATNMFQYIELLLHTVNDREVVRAGVFAFVLPHFFTKADM